VLGTGSEPVLNFSGTGLEPDQAKTKISKQFWCCKAMKTTIQRE